MRYTIHLDVADDARERLRAALKLTGASNIRITEIAVTAETPKIKKDNVPTHPESIAVAALFGRGRDEEWSDVEIALYRKTKCLTLENVALIARYYKVERAKDGIHRRDFTTFLRNAIPELDRARAYAAKRPVSHKGEQGQSDTSKLIEFPPVTEADRLAGEALLAEVHRRKAKTL